MAKLRHVRFSEVAAFAGWTCVGILGASGIAALLTVGIVFLAAAAVVALMLICAKATRGLPMLGTWLGAALVAGYIGWLNRGGPGTVCHTNALGTACTDEWSPWPFFAVAALLAVLSVGLFLLARPGATAAGR